MHHHKYIFLHFQISIICGDVRMICYTIVHLILIPFQNLEHAYFIQILACVQTYVWFMIPTNNWQLFLLRICDSIVRLMLIPFRIQKRIFYLNLSMLTYMWFNIPISTWYIVLLRIQTRTGVFVDPVNFVLFSYYLLITYYIWDMSYSNNKA